MLHRRSPSLTFRLSFGALLALSLMATLVACEDDARFSTKLASDFTQTRHTVSVLGVYKDGRMRADAWDGVASHISPWLGTPRCDAGYSEQFVTANSLLASAIDDYARANGPTDDLLTQLGPAAGGDLILVLTVAGKLPARALDGGVDTSPPPQMSMGGRGGQGQGGMGGYGGGGNARRGIGSRAPGESDVLEISASLFSVPQHEWVAMVGMEYSGKSVDDALARFTAKLTQSLPAATCAGWNWEAKTDPDHIRKSMDP